MPEFYDVLDANEIDGQGSDVEILALEEAVDWTKVMIHPAQELPAGNYDFALSFQVQFSTTNHSIYYRTVGSVILDEEEIHVDRDRPLTRGTYFFNLSWDGGPFNLDIEMSKDGTNYTVLCQHAEFSVKRRT